MCVGHPHAVINVKTCVYTCIYVMNNACLYALCAGVTCVCMYVSICMCICDSNVCVHVCACVMSSVCACACGS